MRHVRITIDYQVPDDVDDADLETLAWAAGVQVDDPADGHGGSADFSTYETKTWWEVVPS